MIPCNIGIVYFSTECLIVCSSVCVCNTVHCRVQSYSVCKCMLCAHLNKLYVYECNITFLEPFIGIQLTTFTAWKQVGNKNRRKKIRIYTFNSRNFIGWTFFVLCAWPDDAPFALCEYQFHVMRTNHLESTRYTEYTECGKEFLFSNFNRILNSHRIFNVFWFPFFWFFWIVFFLLGRKNTH